MRQRLLPACLAGLLLLAPLESAFAAAPALTIEDRSLATRAALDALFSMEALVPEGAAPTLRIMITLWRSIRCCTAVRSCTSPASWPQAASISSPRV
jgi:hypothetical protein